MKYFPLIILAGGLMITSCGEDNSSTTTTTQGDTAVLHDNNNTGTNTTNNNQDRDREFVEEVIALNMAEIDAHTAAQSKATNAEVKAHAGHMLADHKKMGEEMTAFAQKKNYTVATTAPEDKRKELADMNEDKKGLDWDKAYLDQQEKDHENTIDKFEDAQDDVTDPELKQMITKTIPTLQSHLQMVKDAKAKLNK